MAQVLRISVKGTLPGGEEWSTNPCWTISDFGVTTTPEEIADVATACAAVTPNSNLRSAFSTSTAITSIRVEARTAAGVLENLAEAPLPAPSVGTGGGNHPYQTAWVLSLRTAQVGGTGRGRLYWPATGVVLSAGTLRPTASLTDTFVFGAEAYLSDLQTAVRTVFTGASLIVWSRTTQGQYLVDRVQAGDVLDTQRRRRDTLIESYSSLPFP